MAEEEQEEVFLNLLSPLGEIVALARSRFLVNLPGTLAVDPTPASPTSLCQAPPDAHRAPHAASAVPAVAGRRGCAGRAHRRGRREAWGAGGRAEQTAPAGGRQAGAVSARADDATDAGPRRVWHHPQQPCAGGRRWGLCTATTDRSLTE